MRGGYRCHPYPPPFRPLRLHHPENTTAGLRALLSQRHVSRRQWENFLHPNVLEKDSYFIENMQAVEESGKLCLIDGETQLCSAVNLRLFDGHTPGQIAPYITTPGRTYVFAGDVIPLAASVSPEWISAYDTYPVLSYREKVRMLEEAAREKQALIYCHDAYTRCSTVKKVNNFYRKEDVIKM